jgi:Protein of unknown function (DUF616)
VTAAVYTAVIGGYETLREEPLAHASTSEFVCFTDDPGLRSETWRVVVVAPRLPTDPVRSARYLKINGHPELEHHETTLWIDNTVELLAPPEAFLHQWLGDAEVAAPLHAVRSSVLAEAEAVIDLGKDDLVRVYEQLAHYVRTAPAALETNPHWTGMLARRRTPEVSAAMQVWWEHVLRFSRRDQLSFSVVMAAAAARLTSLPLPNRESAVHRWPRAEGRIARDGDALREVLRPPLARIGVLEQECERLQREADAQAMRADEVAADRARLLAEVASLRSAAALLEAEQRSLEGTVSTLRDRVHTLRDRVHTLRERLQRQRSRRQQLEARAPGSR